MRHTEIAQECRANVSRALMKNAVQEVIGDAVNGRQGPERVRMYHLPTPYGFTVHVLAIGPYVAHTMN